MRSVKKGSTKATRKKPQDDGEREALISGVRSAAFAFTGDAEQIDEFKRQHNENTLIVEQAKRRAQRNAVLNVLFSPNDNCMSKLIAMKNVALAGGDLGRAISLAQVIAQLDAAHRLLTR